MRPTVAWLLALLTSVTVLVAWWLSQTPELALEKKLLPTAAKEAPAMVPWREPQRDLARFFPGQSAWKQETLALSSYRQKILTRLGPGETLESNTLYVYRVGTAGSVLVRRFAGEYGAIEVVIAVNPQHKIMGSRIQRHREPPEQARLFEDTSGFRGKGPEDPLPKAHPALARAVRAELIALDTAERR